MRICPSCLRSFADSDRFCPRDGAELASADDVSRNAANATFDALPADLGKEARRNVFERLRSPTVEIARADLQARLATTEASRAQARGDAAGGASSAVAVIAVVLLALAIAAGFFLLLGPTPRNATAPAPPAAAPAPSDPAATAAPVPLATEPAGDPEAGASP